MNDIPEAVFTEYTRLLDEKAGPGQWEQRVQDFLELNPKLLPIPILLNHFVHGSAVVSKMSLTTSLTTDLLYLTKSSRQWKIVLVELENPGKRLFTGGDNGVRPHADLTAALTQVRTWKLAVQKSQSSILADLDPLFYPRPDFSSNLKTFAFVLVMGRGAELQGHVGRREHLQALADDAGVEILTFDSLIGNSRHFPKIDLNILSRRKDGFTFKHLHCEPESMFAEMSREVLHVSPRHETTLRSWGYEIDKWKAGELLKWGKTVAMPKY